MQAGHAAVNDRVRQLYDILNNLAPGRRLGFVQEQPDIIKATIFQSASDVVTIIPLLSKHDHLSYLTHALGNEVLDQLLENAADLKIFLQALAHHDRIAFIETLSEHAMLHIFNSGESIATVAPLLSHDEAMELLLSLRSIIINDGNDLTAILPMIPQKNSFYFLTKLIGPELLEVAITSAESLRMVLTKLSIDEHTRFRFINQLSAQTIQNVFHNAKDIMTVFAALSKEDRINLLKRLNYHKVELECSVNDLVGLLFLVGRGNFTVAGLTLGKANIAALLPDGEALANALEHLKELDPVNYRLNAQSFLNAVFDIDKEHFRNMVQNTDQLAKVIRALPSEEYYRFIRMTGVSQVKKLLPTKESINIIEEGISAKESAQFRKCIEVAKIFTHHDNFSKEREAKVSTLGAFSKANKKAPAQDVYIAKKPTRDF